MWGPAKRVALTIVLLAAVSAATHAETMFVNDVMEVTLRTGEGIQHRIVAMLKSGQEITVVSKGAEWTRVRLPSGKEGYVLSRFLTTDPPAVLALQKLQKEYDELQQMTAEPLKELKAIKQENDALKEDLATKEQQLEEVTGSYDMLKEESADFLELNANYKKSKQELAEARRRAETYEQELGKIQFNQNIRWFLTGAGVMLLGFILGFSTRRQRRRSSLL